MTSPYSKVLTHTFPTDIISDPPVQVIFQKVSNVIFNTFMSPLSKTVLIYAYQHMLVPVHIMVKDIRQALEINDKDWEYVTGELKAFDLMHFVNSGGVGGTVLYFNDRDIEHRYIELIELDVFHNISILAEHKLYKEQDREEALAKYKRKKNQKTFGYPTIEQLQLGL